jgi:excinuclease ABC subunit C
VCDGTVSKNDYKQIVNKIELLLSGKTSNLKSNLKKEMAVLSCSEKYEKAKEVRDQIFALEHIQDVALLPLIDEERVQAVQKTGKGKLRIEAYDVAHLSGTNNVGVMVVMEGNELKKSDYRKFIIKNSKGNDLGALKEILERRLKHSEWPMPDLIVVDGGVGQLNTAKLLINNIPIIAVTKDDKHKAKAIIGLEELANKYKKEILRINAEAHRFAIAFHRQKRSAII